MKETRIAFEADLADLEADAWTERMDALCDDLGYFEPLGDHHFAAFIDAGPKLLVTFENAETIRKTHPGAEPRGFAYVRDEGWSHLAIVSDDDSWFRAGRIYAYFDRLIDDGFFEDFDRVLFYGAHAAAYAACAYSVAAPGCTVLALRPVATLDPRVAGFDSRFTHQRRQDFTSRYGYAPEMIDAVDRAYIAFDPLQQLDAIHAALFTRRNMTPLRCTGLGQRLDQAFDTMGFHEALIVAAMDGTLTEIGFARMLRARRNYVPYLRGLFAQMVKRDHPVLAANVAAHVLRQRPDAFFAKKLEELRAQGHEPSRPFKMDAAE